MIEEPLGDNRGFIETREQKCVCVDPFTENSHPVFSQQVSKSRAQGCRWTEAKLKWRRRGKREREELRSSSLTRRETSTMSRVQCCATGAVRARKDVRNTPTDGQHVRSSGLLAVRDCRVSSRSMNESSPTVLGMLRRTHGAERACQVVREAIEPHAVDCVRVIHMFNRSKRNQVRSRVVTRDNTARVSAPEHCVIARACRMMLKGHTHQLVSYDVSAVARERCAGKASERFQIER